jgi:hypothetical protein
MRPIQIHVWYGMGAYPIHHMAYQIILFSLTLGFSFWYVLILAWYTTCQSNVFPNHFYDPVALHSVPHEMSHSRSREILSNSKNVKEGSNPRLGHCTLRVCSASLLLWWEKKFVGVNYFFPTQTVAFSSKPKPILIPYEAPNRLRYHSSNSSFVILYRFLLLAIYPRVAAEFFI